MRPTLTASGTPTAVGSLPHERPDDALGCVLAALPELPAAPQLPARHPAEGMLAQAASGMAGVTVAADGTLAADPHRLDTVDPEVALQGPSWGTLRCFLEAVAGRTAPIKLQATGPLTLALALHRAGVPAPLAFTVAGAQVRTQVRALVDAAREVVPAAVLVVVVDEPGAVAMGAPRFPFSFDGALDLISGALATMGPEAVTGIHCCGPVDWRLLLQAGPDLLSVPVEHAPSDDPGALSGFLERGGIVAWGAVPTDRPLAAGPEGYWRRLSDTWCDLARGGCDPGLLRTQALITPACGLAGHGPDQVPAVLGLVRSISERVQDQALATRLSAGA